jgi:hypothetical protein
MSLAIDFIAVIVKVTDFCEKFGYEPEDLPEEDTDGLIYKDESMNPMDAEDTIASMQKKGLRLFTDQTETEFADIAIVDVIGGMNKKCFWLECGEFKNGTRIVRMIETSTVR